jgi:hypothetical protein
MAIDKPTTKNWSYNAELRVNGGVYKSGLTPNNGTNKAFVLFMSDDGKSAQYWSHDKPITEFILYRGNVYLLDITGQLFKQQKETWELVQGKSGYFATFIKLPEDLDLITCFPVPITKELPDGQSRTGGCRSIEKRWNIEVTWDQSAVPPVVCENEIAITGFVITGKHDTQGWRNRQKILQSIRLNDGQLSTVRKLPKDIFKTNLCSYLQH